MLIKLGCVAEITVASFLILLGHCLQAVKTTTIMCRGTAIMHFHHRSVLIDTEQHATSEAEQSTANKCHICRTCQRFESGSGVTLDGVNKVEISPSHPVFMEAEVSMFPATVPQPSSSRLHSLLIKHLNAMNYWSEADAVSAVLSLRLHWWRKTSYSS